MLGVTRSFRPRNSRSQSPVSTSSNAGCSATALFRHGLTFRFASTSFVKSCSERAEHRRLYKRCVKVAVAEQSINSQVAAAEQLIKSQIAAATLLNFKRLKQRFEIAFAKALNRRQSPRYLRHKSWYNEGGNRRKSASMMVAITASGCLIINEILDFCDS